MQNQKLQYQLDAADLQKKAKELDAREEALIEKLKALDEAPMSLAVLEAQLKNKAQQLEGIIHDIRLKQDELDTVKSLYAAESSGINRDRLALKEALKRLQSEHDNLTSLIEDRKKYLKSQEKLITSTINKGNRELVNLNYDVNKQTEELDQIITKRDSITRSINGLEIARNELRASVDDLQIEKVMLEQDVSSLDAKYNNILKQHKNTLESINQEIVEIAARKESIEKSIDSKMASLKEKEESIKTKRDALAIERAQLEEDKRRWNSQKELYDL